MGAVHCEVPRGAMGALHFGVLCAVGCCLLPHAVGCRVQWISATGRVLWGSVGLRVLWGTVYIQYTLRSYMGAVRCGVQCPVLCQVLRGAVVAVRCGDLYTLARAATVRVCHAVSLGCCVIWGAVCCRVLWIPERCLVDLECPGRRVLWGAACCGVL